MVIVLPVYTPQQYSNPIVAPAENILHSLAYFGYLEVVRERRKNRRSIGIRKRVAITPLTNEAVPGE